MLHHTVFAEVQMKTRSDSQKDVSPRFARFRPLVKTVGVSFPAALLALTASGVACSSGSNGSSSSSTSGLDVPDAALLGGQPCEGLNSGFPGDGLCISAPDPTYGTQFHFGPVDYTNSAEVANFLLQPGDELTECTFFMTANAEPVYFNEYHSRMRPGSHHMLLYIQPPGGVTETGADGGPVDCTQGLQTRNLFGATTPTLDVSNFDGAPENAGLAVEIPATQQGVMQAHFINTGSEPILREVWANIVYTPKSSVKTLGDPIFFLAGLTMNVGEGTSTTIHGTATVPEKAAENFRLVVAEPHFHTHLTRYEVTATIGGQTTTILEQFPVLNTVTDPIIRWFDSLTTNPTIDVANKTPGAFSGDVYLKKGDTIDWYCDITNNDQPQALQFTEQVYKGEMCNLFGLYAPSTGGPWYGYNP
jgi:hypothetical protein